MDLPALPPEIGPLVVEDLSEAMKHLDQISLIGHHPVDVLVRAGDLIDELVGVAGLPHPVAHLRGQVGAGEAASSLTTGHSTTGPVRTRMVRILVAPAPHDVAAGAHRPGDDAKVVHVGLDCSLAGNPHRPAVVDLAGGEVVMAV